MRRNSTTATVVVACVVILSGLLSAWIVPMVTHRATSVVVATSISASVTAATALTKHGTLKFNPMEFSGYYSDPNHLHCQRIIQVAGSLASLSGTDGNPGCSPSVDGSGGGGEPWTLEGQIIGNQIVVDFSPKGGPANLKGTYEDGANNDAKAGIQWLDGNKWIKLRPLVVDDGKPKLN